MTTDGYIRPRSLNVTVQGAYGCDPHVCAEPRPSLAPDLRVEMVPNGAALDLALSWTAVPGSGYQVLQSTEPTFRSGVVTLGNTTATSLTLPDGARTTPARTFFQARAVNACHQEGP